MNKNGPTHSGSTSNGRINNSSDISRQFTEATKGTTFKMPNFIYDDKGYAHTIKNAITRFIFSMDSIKEQGLPRGSIRRGASGVKYLVNTTDVDGKTDAIVQKWMSHVNESSENCMSSDGAAMAIELMNACTSRRYPLAFPQDAEAYDLGPFLTFAFAIATVFNSTDVDSDFVINVPFTTFIGTKDAERLDADLRSRLAAVIFFRLNGPEVVERSDFNKADAIIIKTLTNDVFTVSHTWEQFWTLGGKNAGSMKTLADYRRMVMNDNQRDDVVDNCQIEGDGSDEN